LGLIEFSQKKSAKIIMISASAAAILFILIGIIMSAGGGLGNPTTFTLTAANMHRTGDDHLLNVFGEFTEIQTRTTPGSSVGTPVTFEITGGIGVASFLNPAGNRVNTISIPSGNSVVLALNRNTYDMFTYTRPWQQPVLNITVRCANLRLQNIAVRVNMVEESLKFEYELQVRTTSAGEFVRVPTQTASVTNILNPNVTYRVVFRWSVLGETYIDSLATGQFPGVSAQRFEPDGTPITHGIRFEQNQIVFPQFPAVPEPMRFSTSINFAHVYYDFYFTVNFVA